MKKTLMTGVFLALSGVVLSAGGAMAIPTSADYWTVTDATTGINGTIDSNTNMFGTAGASLAALLGVSYLNRDVVGSFGLYSDLDQNKVINPTTEHFKVIDGTIPGIGYRNASTFFHFNSSLSAWEVAAVDIWAPGYVGTVTPKAFGNVFGFYFSGAQNPNSFFYTDAFYNGGIEYVSIDYTPYVASIRFDFGNNGTIDAIINTTDVAPVPEPATMLLLGTGLVGLAGTTRKRMKKA